MTADALKAGGSHCGRSHRRCSSESVGRGEKDERGSLSRGVRLRVHASVNGDGRGILDLSSDGVACDGCRS